MTAPLRALASLLATALLAGCSSLPFFAKDEGADGAATREDGPKVALYEFDAQAPAPLRKLLLDFLDLSRFQKAPEDEAISGRELDRLAAAAPAQARSLLETEGYFDATVRVEKSAGADGKTRIVMTVEPGPRVRIASVEIGSTTPLAVRTPTRDDDTTDTHALIDATAETAALDLQVTPGPLYHLGAIQVEGIQRYREAAVRRLSTFRTGDVYSEKALLDYQERLVKAGLFEGASVEIDAEAGPPEATPVLVKVKELPQQQATFGVGYSANTGPRVSVDHYDRKVFGWPWIAHSTLVYGPNLKTIGTELTSYPLEDLKRNLVGVNVEQLKGVDETRDAAALRVGRSQDTGFYERLYFGELSRARVSSALLTTTSSAAAAHYHWLRRDVDNVLLPTRGAVLALQGAVGYGTGNETRSDLPGVEETARGPFVRPTARSAPGS